MNARKHLLLPALVLTCTGCYTFRPAAPESLLPGTAVRTLLSPSEAERVTGMMGRSSGAVVHGTLLRIGPDSLVVEVWRTDFQGGRAFSPGRVGLALERNRILELEEKRLSYWRTGGVASGAAVGLYLLIRAVWGGAGGGLEGGGPGNGI